MKTTQPKLSPVEIVRKFQREYQEALEKGSLARTTAEANHWASVRAVILSEMQHPDLVAAAKYLNGETA